MRDFLYLLVVIVLCMLIHAVALNCEKTRMAMEEMKLKVDSLQRLLATDAKVDVFLRQLKAKQSAR